MPGLFEIDEQVVVIHVSDGSRRRAALLTCTWAANVRLPWAAVRV